jgi:hypothetical protein
MGNEGRQRFPERTTGTVTFKRGQKRKPAKQEVTVVYPSGPAKPAGKKHSKTKDLTI